MIGTITWHFQKFVIVGTESDTCAHLSSSLQFTTQL